MKTFSARDRLKLLSGIAASVALSACGGGGGSSDPTPTPSPSPTPTPTPTPAPVMSLRDVYADHFRIGAAIGPAQVTNGSPDLALLQRHFSSITAENVMKPAYLAPSPGVYTFDDADALVDWATTNNHHVRGHALVWYQETPNYFFDGSPSDVRSRLENYITEVMTRYRGRVQAWDAVNEGVADFDSSTSPYRNSNWYQAAGGPDYIEWALRAARAADPDARLFINEYNTELPEKRARFMTVIRQLLDKGVPLDGIGHQCHIDRTTKAGDVLDAIDAVDVLNAGLENHVTELDMTVYNDSALCYSDGINCAPAYTNGAPAEALISQGRTYRNLFNGLKARPSVTSVTSWGVCDDQSWLNHFPVERENFPLLFDRQRNPKPAFHAITDPAYVITQ